MDNENIKEILDYLQENSKKDEATKQLVDYITNLQKENDKLKKLEYKFFYCSEDEESFTLEDYLELGNKVYDLEQENERLKEENKHIFANVNDDQLLRSNAMNWAEAQDYKSRIEKAVEIIDLIKPELWNISNKMTYRLIDIEKVLNGKE